MQVVFFVQKDFFKQNSVIFSILKYLSEKSELYVISSADVKISMSMSNPKITFLNIPEQNHITTFTDYMSSISPQMLFLMSDVETCMNIFNKLNERQINKTFNIITYICAKYTFERPELIEQINPDHILVSNDNFKNSLILTGINSDKVSVLPFWVLPNEIPNEIPNELVNKIDKTEARIKFKMIEQDDFVILNPNPNKSSSGLDRTIDVFIKFLAKHSYMNEFGRIEPNEKIKLYLRFGLDELNNPDGYDIINQVKVACISNGLNYDQVLIKNIFTSNLNNVDEVNNLLNSCDVGISTNVDENYLCVENLIHGLLCNPQIFACEFQESLCANIKPVCELYKPNSNGSIGGYRKYCSVNEIVDVIEEYYQDKNLLKTRGQTLSKEILNMYGKNKAVETIKEIFDKIIFAKQTIAQQQTLLKTQMQKRDPTLYLKQYQFYMGLKYHMEEALDEYKLDANISTNCPDIALFSSHYYSQIRELCDEKIFDYCFIGSINSCYERRVWVIEFAKKYFTPNSIFVNTDVNESNANWTKLGDYDLSYAGLGFCPKSCEDNQSKKVQYREIKDNLFYFQTMKQSKYVLCPAGDSLWSFRFYEVLMCESIPIVELSRHTFRTIEESYINYEHIKLSDILNKTNDEVYKTLFDEEKYHQMVMINTSKFCKYHMLNKQLLFEKSLITNYLNSIGFMEFENYSHQIYSQIIDLMLLTNKPNLKIMEIGFNAGHSAETFLSSSSNSTLTSFNLGIHNYVLPAHEYINKTFFNRHKLILGDSTKTIPLFTQSNPDIKFDVIFIDGCHEYEFAKADIENCSKLAHSDTIVILDDTMTNLNWQRQWNVGPSRAWDEYVKAGKIIEINRKDYCIGRGMSWGFYS